ncbi:MAG: aspartate kinase [Synergistaceae bacterium]|jgi:aspartate kinase|nr:aspartate kinase [Synergistaceae bacterium]
MKSEIVVQKYGGSSMAGPERVRGVAARVAARLASEQGAKLVVVVSAMGKTTDGLLALASEVSPTPAPRETDMLLATGEQVSAALLTMALLDLGIPAVSRNAFQLGVVTSANYSNARIMDIDVSRLLGDLEDYDVVVVTGFQGVTERGDLTTLGRGGSDTSAVAIAAKLSRVSGVLCEIYSDVPGIFACDPNKVRGARKLDYIRYDEMLELASLGAKVLHMRAVELARKYGVVLYCASTFSNERGTYVVRELPEWLESPVVTGVTVARSQTRFVVRRISGSDALTGIFDALADAGANVDMISTVSAGDETFMAFTIASSEAVRAKRALAALDCEAEAGTPVAKVSVVGDGMNAATGVAGRVFGTLRHMGADIMGISTSDINISVLVAEDEADEAVEALANEFGLTSDS